MSANCISHNISGIHSKQPWFVLSADTFLTNLTVENPVVSHFYRFELNKSESPTIAIPDGCVDLIFYCNPDKPSAMVCGTTLQARQIEFDRNHPYFGVRFVPGVFPDFLEIDAEELIEKQYNMLDLIPNTQSLFEQVITAENFSQQINIVNAFLKKIDARSPSKLTTQIVAKICQQKGNIQIKELERYSGYSTRTLQRLFKQDVGLTPKGFSRAIRCQSAIYDINHSDRVIFSDLACDLGFSDQSHFLREFKKLVNATPMEYQHQVKQSTYLERIHCY
ncbi:helix-turn-helix domain-containing protein [Vibrio salinus]|uniref:helix-turn-helix domain-containing protein n=1 Tax=Vibrio salinus TaxID=2899784 RepID=UPI001E569FC4|nr:AraC family transcriptional regulator [Vibrio salinus]MCE0494813.1 AraC family transcriptional regulator [Vibrio salinus]